MVASAGRAGAAVAASKPKFPDFSAVSTLRPLTEGGNRGFGEFRVSSLAGVFYNDHGGKKISSIGVRGRAQ